MGEYLIVCVLFLNMIIASKTWPHETRENLYIKGNGDNLVRQSTLYKREVSAMAPRKDKKNDDIIFPDVTPSTQTRGGVSIDYSASGKGMNCIEGVCTDAKDYPYDRIKEVLGKLTAYSKLFGFVEGAIVNTSTRFQDKGGDVESLCATTVRTVYPKTLKNENSTERFIINVEGNTQGLVYETCVENAKCRFESLFPNNYISECTQKFAKRRLMALGEDGNPAFDTFIVPSCCVCTIKQVKTD